MHFTVVIPLRILPGTSRDRRRLGRLLRSLPSGVEAVVADDTGCHKTRAITARMVSRFSHARHVPFPESADQTFSIGRLRDLGAAEARDGTVMFHDVDFTAPSGTYRHIVTHARSLFERDGQAAFFCVPVNFLTPLGTAALNAAPGALWPRLWRAGERAPRMLSRRLVLGSSAIVVRRATLRACGGHSPAFSGHGAEDFELMHRLSHGCPKGERPDDYHTDFGSAAAGTGGFRAYFARYGREALAQGLMLAHLWHPSRRGDPRYQEARPRNFERLEAVLRGEAAG